MRLDTEEYAYSVEFMCGRLGVSRSGYYDWRSRPESATARRRGDLKLLIKKAFDTSDSTYGHRRIRAQLGRGSNYMSAEFGKVLTGLDSADLPAAPGYVSTTPWPNRSSAR
ncbi:hypothetical protein QFZ67_000232 [Streptomyces sp. V1I1]|nr:hypothetical protein [Streptomyces sp. V1I1]